MRRLELKIALNPNTGDHAILQTALEFRDESPDKPTIFVTMGCQSAHPCRTRSA